MLKRMAIIAIFALAACQTVPRAKHGFTPAQVSALTGAGFKSEGRNYELGLNERFLFDIDSSHLTSTARASIDNVTQVLNGVGIHGAATEGHTDSTGTSPHNKQLSKRRADVVKAELVQAGMIAAKVRSLGKGERQPIASNATVEGRAQNRRVVIIVTPTDAN
jgi:OOP family OmpA-OmpF porin